MTYDTEQTMTELLNAIAQQRARAEELRQLPIESLHQRPEPKRWSVAEVFEHMNLSSGHYLDRLQRIYASPSRRTTRNSTFEPGRWGEMGVKAMRPDANGRISWHMKTLWMFEPKSARTVGYASLDRFVEMLDGFTKILQEAREKGWEGPRVTSTLGPLLRFKVCDAIRFPIAHQERHMLQIDHTLEMIRAMKKVN